MCTHLCLELRGWYDFSNVRANETVYTYCVSMYSRERCRKNITFEFGAVNPFTVTPDICSIWTCLVI